MSKFRGDLESLANTIYISILDYDKAKPEDIHGRIRYLLRATRFLKSTIEMVLLEKALEKGLEEEAKACREAIKRLETLRYYLKKLNADVRLNTLIAKANRVGWNDPNIISELYSYVNRLDDYCAELVDIMVAMGLTMYNPLVVGSEERD